MWLFASNTEFLGFLLAIGVLTVSPGADTMMVIRNSLRGGQLDGWITSFGICCGLFIHALLSAGGLSFILAQSALAFTAMKWLGAAYLIWLGWQSLRGARLSLAIAAEDTAGIRESRWRVLCEGFLSNVLNPKTAMFYLAFLPQFIRLGEPVLLKSLWMALLHFMLAFLWQGGVAILVNVFRRMLQRGRVKAWLDRVTGIVLIGLGARLGLG